MTKYRKKPVVIEAMQFDGTKATGYKIEAWSDYAAVLNEPPTHLRIFTLEGTMTAGAGDWIIRGVKGEFYPCKDDIFQATYEVCE